MDLIRKIGSSRKIFKKYLESEWDVSVISDYSEQEIEKLYSSKHKNNIINFGKASAFNIMLSHKNIPSHNLHIIYYNFPELNSPPLKITKMCGEKMNSLYSSGIIEPEDSIILIILENVTENIQTTIESLYKKGQEELIKNGLSDNIIEENEKLNENKYNLEHFKNIHVFDINSLCFDIMEHVSVPKHECIRNNSRKTEIFEMTNTTLNKLPIILRTDPVAKLLRMAPGDICEITRKSERCGEYKFYRICEQL
jgi:DNA-directed RNA polymerase subunit H (RpoH/RPB5)